MNDPIALLLPPGSPTTGRFPETSRYHTVATAILERDGREIVYLRRRFVPPPERFALLGEHTVVQDERLDQIAARHLGDAERFWQLADANRALDPDALTDDPGGTVRVTLPEGIPGPDDG